MALAMAQAEPSGARKLTLDTCEIRVPEGVESVTETVSGPTENAPALKVGIGEGDMKTWEGKLDQKLGVSEPGTYSITFLARAEPADSSVELSVLAARSGRSERITERTHENIRTEWTEIHFVFVTEQEEPNLTLSCSGLGRPGSTWYFSDFTVKKE